MNSPGPLHGTGDARPHRKGCSCNAAGRSPLRSGESRCHRTACRTGIHGAAQERWRDSPIGRRRFRLHSRHWRIRTYTTVSGRGIVQTYPDLCRRSSAACIFATFPWTSPPASPWTMPSRTPRSPPMQSTWHGATMWCCSSQDSLGSGNWRASTARPSTCPKNSCDCLPTL